MATQSKSAKDKIIEKTPPVLEQIPFVLVEKHSNKITKLLANSQSTSPVEGKNKWFSFDFSEPVFIYRVVINNTNYPDYKDFELEAMRLDGSRVLRSSKPTSGRVFLEVNDLCTSVRFRPPQAYLHYNKTIDSVEIYGFDRKEAGSFIQFSRDIDLYKTQAIIEIDRREASYQDTIQKAAAAAVEAAGARSEVSKLKSQADRLKTQLRSLESEKNDLNTKLEVLRENISNNDRELQIIKTELNTKSGQKLEIESIISSKENDLSELRKNIDLFPSELDSFVKQGAINNKTLFWISSIPITIIFVIFVLLVTGAADLSTKITGRDDINILALIVSRTPYVIISVTIIAACYQIVRYFISELINVNRQRLNLTKVSIVAKDVSAAAEAGLELSEIERYALRVRLKMDLLKDHLKGYVSPEFEVSLPKNITNYLDFDTLSSKPSPNLSDDVINEDDGRI